MRWATSGLGRKPTNHGGSTKDRIGLSMIEAAERGGRLQAGGMAFRI
jgi:cysteine synthase